MKNKKTIIAIAGFAVLLIACYGLYYIMSKNYNGNQSDQNLVQNNQTEDLNLMNSDSNQSEIKNGENANNNNSDSELGVLIGSSETIAANNDQNQNEPVTANANASEGENAVAPQNVQQPNTNNNTQQPNTNNNTTTAADTTGTPAADFTVYDNNGKAVSLSGMFGKPMVLNFWASWCNPCKSEMPYFQSAFESYGNKVQFVMVNLTDGQKETKAKANDYINSQGYTFPVYYDTNQYAVNAYSVYSVPQTYFISASGRIIAKSYGTITQNQLQSNINTLINR